MATEAFQFEKMLLLGSQSPRRRELLEKMQLPFRPVSLIFDEPPGIDNPLEMARRKALAYSAVLKEDEVLLTADTMVFTDGKKLGKPANQYEALDMLEGLSGRWHKVVTGVCLRTRDDLRCFEEQTRILFGELSKEEMNFYVCRFMPLDKAGAYGIQEWIGLIGVERIEGSFYNVMGLPTKKLWREWLKINDYPLSL